MLDIRRGLPPPPSAEPTPMDRRAAAAQATLDQFKGVPFRWGKADCVQLVAFHLRALGYDPTLPAAGYRSVRSAKEALRSLGYRNLGASLDALGLPRITPAATIVGDIVEWPSATPGLQALGVQLGNGRTVAYHPEAAGAAVLQLSEWVAAWRVTPL